MRPPAFQPVGMTLARSDERQGEPPAKNALAPLASFPIAARLHSLPTRWTAKNRFEQDLLGLWAVSRLDRSKWVQLLAKRGSQSGKAQKSTDNPRNSAKLRRLDP